MINRIIMTTSHLLQSRLSHKTFGQPAPASVFCLQEPECGRKLQRTWIVTQELLFAQATTDRDVWKLTYWAPQLIQGQGHRHLGKYFLCSLLGLSIHKSCSIHGHNLQNHIAALESLSKGALSYFLYFGEIHMLRDEVVHAWKICLFNLHSSSLN